MKRFKKIIAVILAAAILLVPFTSFGATTLKYNATSPKMYLHFQSYGYITKTGSFPIIEAEYIDYYNGQQVGWFNNEMFDCQVFDYGALPRDMKAGDHIVINIGTHGLSRYKSFQTVRVLFYNTSSGVPLKYARNEATYLSIYKYNGSGGIYNRDTGEFRIPIVLSKDVSKYFGVAVECNNATYVPGYGADAIYQKFSSMSIDYTDSTVSSTSGSTSSEVNGTLQNNHKNIIDNLRAWFQSVINFLSGVIDTIYSSVKTLGDDIGYFYENTFINWMSNLYNIGVDARGKLNSIISTLESKFNTLTLFLVQDLSDLGTSIKNWFSTLPTRLSDWFGDVGDWFGDVGDWFRQIGANIRERFSILGDNLREWFASVGNWFSSLGERIGGFFENLGNKLTDKMNSLFDIPYCEEHEQDWSICYNMMFDELMAERFGIVYNSFGDFSNIVENFKNHSQLNSLVIIMPTLKLPSVVGGHTLISGGSYTVLSTDGLMGKSINVNFWISTLRFVVGSIFYLALFGYILRLFKYVIDGSGGEDL